LRTKEDSNETKANSRRDNHSCAGGMLKKVKVGDYVIAYRGYSWEKNKQIKPIIEVIRVDKLWFKGKLVRSSQPEYNNDIWNYYYKEVVANIPKKAMKNLWMCDI